MSKIVPKTLSGSSLVLHRIIYMDAGEFIYFSYHPAPFFVLDEIDAALDNTNISKVHATQYPWRIYKGIYFQK